MSKLPLLNSQYCNVEAAQRVKYLIANLAKNKSDKRKLRIKKMEYIEWFLMVDKLYQLNILNNQTMSQDEGRLLYYYESLMNHSEIVLHKIGFIWLRLQTYDKMIFLKMVDNAFLMYMAQIDKYIGSTGKIIPISQIHPNHHTSIVNKLKKGNYTLPNQFKPIDFVVE